MIAVNRPAVSGRSRHRMSFYSMGWTALGWHEVIVTLENAGDARRFGSKAASLARAVAAGLRVPRAIVLAPEAAAAVAAGDVGAEAALRLAAAHLPAPLAVRSTAVGEDGSEASFAGQHQTLLGVGPDDLVDAVTQVARSAAGSRAYRARLGLGEAPMAVLVQALVPAEASGVAFTCDPVTGGPGVVIEAAWGLGEVVVQGQVTPDHWRIAPDGSRRFQAGFKDVALRWQRGRAGLHPVATELVEAPCLDDRALEAVLGLLRQVDALWPGPHDVEFALEGGRAWLLQRRPVTRGR